MSAPAIRPFVAPGAIVLDIPTINLDDPSHHLPIRCSTCHKRALSAEEPVGGGTGRLVCWNCSAENAWLVRHPVRRELTPEEWAPRRGRPPKPCTHHERHGLTHEGIADIRRQYATGASPIGIAHRYGVSRQTIYQIAVRNMWKCVP